MLDLNGKLVISMHVKKVNLL